MRVAYLFLLALYNTTVIYAQLLLDAIQQTSDLSQLNTILNKYPALHDLYQAAENYTLLAPSNSALSLYLNQTAGISTQVDDLVAALQYHLVHGTYADTEFTTTAQYPSTWLTNTSYTNITGGQRVKLFKGNGAAQIESGNQTISLIKTADVVATGGLLHVIDTVLNVPTDLVTQSTVSNYNYFITILTNGGFLSQESFNFSQGILMMSDLTTFVPNSQGALNTFNSLVGNLSTLQRQAVFDYHIVNSTVHYDVDLVDGFKMKTIQGNDLTIQIAPNGTQYVNGMRIISSDMLVENGVLHVIDGLLDPNNITTAVFPATSATPSAPPSATSSPGASEPANPPASTGLTTGAKAGIAIGVVAVIFLVAGGVFFFRRKKRNVAELGSHDGAEELPTMHGDYYEGASNKMAVTSELHGEHAPGELPASWDRIQDYGYVDHPTDHTKATELDAAEPRH